MWREDTDGDLADRTVADGDVAVDDVSWRGHKSRERSDINPGNVTLGDDAPGDVPQET